MKKYLIVSQGYPTTDNVYNNMFIHTRVKNYIKNNINVEVFYFKADVNQLTNYKYEDVNVMIGNQQILKNIIKTNNYDKIIIHFAFEEFTQTIFDSIDKKTPILIWVHGYEALGWYRRLFNLSFNIEGFRKFYRYIIRNKKQLNFMHKVITEYCKEYNITFIFVSMWMKKVLEKDSHSNGLIKKYYIIPNVIDNKIFIYDKKNNDLRFNIVNIRSYNSRKYANDITVKVIKKLSHKKYFNKLNISLYGEGHLFNKLTKPLKKYENVHLYNYFLNSKEINQVYENNGIMLIPTRQDAQGVSMCESMMSGLVPIASLNTAIPEYVNEKNGYLCSNVAEMVKSIEELIFNSSIFEKKSINANKSMMVMCSPNVVIKKEIEVIRK